MTRVCSNCGSTVKDTAKFCKYCGRPLTSAPQWSPRQSIPSVSTIARQPPPVTEVPADVLAQLEIRSELMMLAQEEGELKGEIERLQGELEKGEESIAEIEEKMKALQKKIKALSSREKKLKAQVKEFPFEEAGKARRLWSDRLEKLEELKGQTRESVYHRLKGEYETGLREAEAKYSEQLILAKEWLALLKAQYVAARDELAMLEARQGVGEVGESKYIESKERLEKKMQKLGTQVEVLEEILRRIQ